MKIYAYKGTYKNLMSSSSGGAFSRIVQCLTENMIPGSYSIYGAAWNEKMQVEHRRIDDYKDIDIFKGSKYVSSRMDNVFHMVKEDLEKGVYVIFSGTPCQVHALNLFLKKYSISDINLFTIDIICHGTPHPSILESFIDWINRRYNNKVVQITFRDKNISWKRYPTSILMGDGKKYCNSYETQLYMRMFFSALIYNRKCFSCQHANLNRISDLTIGDFWGIEEIMPELFDEKGVSLVLVNSNKGQLLLEKMVNQEMNDSIKEYIGNLQLILNKQQNLSMCTMKPKMYDEFWKDYTEKGFEYCLEKYGFMTFSGRIKFYIKKILYKIPYYDTRM